MRRLVHKLLILSMVILIPLEAWAVGDTFNVDIYISGDTIPPTVPTNVIATAAAIDQIDVTWDASTDNIAVTGYQVFRDSIQIATTTLTNYSDTGLTPSTTYAYNITAFDFEGNISTTSATATATTLPPTPSSTPDVSGVGGGELLELVQPELTLLGLDITTNTNSATIHWDTSVLALSVLRWGESEIYEQESIAESFFLRAHEVTLTDLEPGTTYHFLIEMRNQLGNKTLFVKDTFTTDLLPDDTPPQNVSGLTAYIDEDDVVLSWNNPGDDDFEKVRILGSDRFYPSDPADGRVAYEGKGEIFRDRDAALGTGTRYYTVFAYDKRGNISSGAVVKVTIGQDTGEVPATPEEPIDTVHLRFGDVIFSQEGKRIPVVDERVTVNGAKKLIISIPYEKLPEHLKTILIDIQDPKDKSKVFSFLLRVNKEKTFYSAIIAPFGRSGDHETTISVFDFKTEMITKAKGTIATMLPVYAKDEEGVGFIGYLKELSERFWWIWILLLFLLIWIIYRLGKDWRIEKRPADAGWSIPQ